MKNKMKDLFGLIKEKFKQFIKTVRQSELITKTVITIKSFVTETIKIVQKLFQQQGWKNKKIFLKETIHQMNQTRKRVLFGSLALLFLLFIGILFYPEGERIKRSNALD